MNGHLIEKGFIMLKRYLYDEAGNGAETVEIVIGIICSVGLGAALLSFQDTLREAISNNGDYISKVFDSLANGAGVNVGGGSTGA